MGKAGKGGGLDYTPVPALVPPVVPPLALSELELPPPVPRGHAATLGRLELGGRDLAAQADRARRRAGAGGLPGGVTRAPVVAADEREEGQDAGQASGGHGFDFTPAAVAMQEMDGSEIRRRP